MAQSNRSDLQIHAADADALAAQAVEGGGGSDIERQDTPPGGALEGVHEEPILRDLVPGVSRATDDGEPTLQVFFRRDGRNDEGGIGRRCHSRQKSVATRIPPKFQSAVVIRIEQNHESDRRFSSSRQRRPSSSA